MELLKKKQKPEIVHFYNKTKCGVDVVDNMLRKYTTKSKTNHWPLAVFFDLLDKAAVNAHIIFKESTGDKVSRKKFITQLGEELCENNKDVSFPCKQSRKIPQD